MRLLEYFKTKKMLIKKIENYKHLNSTLCGYLKRSDAILKRNTPWLVEKTKSILKVILVHGYFSKEHTDNGVIDIDFLYNRFGNYEYYKTYSIYWIDDNNIDNTPEKDRKFLIEISDDMAFELVYNYLLKKYPIEGFIEEQIRAYDKKEKDRETAEKNRLNKIDNFI